MKTLRTAVVLLLGGLVICSQAQNLLRNPDFETVPNGAVGQGILPSDWIDVIPSPDTYSNDGSYGLPPATLNNFSGVVAHSGIRWVAGWSGVPEIFGQILTSALVGGRTYEISCFLHQSSRGDLNNPGTYEVTLRQAGLPMRVLGRFPNTVSVGQGWVFRRFEFTAPADAGLYQTIAFDPKATPPANSYPGMDLVSLVAIGATTVPIHANLQDYVASPMGVTLVVEVRNPGSTSPIETHDVPLDTSGNGSFNTNLNGTFDLAGKAPHWLRHTVTNVALTGGANFQLVNGDSDDDNEVAIGDYAILSGAYNNCAGDPGWDARADLNGDDCCDIADYAVLSANYGLVGDE